MNIFLDTLYFLALFYNTGYIYYFLVKILQMTNVDFRVLLSSFCISLATHFHLFPSIMIIFEVTIHLSQK